MAAKPSSVVTLEIRMKRIKDPGRKFRRDTNASPLERAILDVRRAFRMEALPRAYLVAARALIRKAQKDSTPS